MCSFAAMCPLFGYENRAYSRVLRNPAEIGTYGVPCLINIRVGPFLIQANQENLDATSTTFSGKTLLLMHEIDPIKLVSK